jgi:hypothetical protein
MSNQAQASPAGWYRPNPMAPNEVRYWDGAAWTARHEMAVARPTNGMSIASMVLGIVGIPSSIYLVAPILALVFGYVSRSQIRSSGQSGAGMAKAGIILGYVGIGLGIAFWLIFIIAIAASEPSTTYSP